MAEDYIEEAQREAQLRFGKTLSADELAETFKGHDFEARIQHLKNLSADDGVLTVAEAAERHSYTSALRATHDRLSKVGR